MSHRTILCIYFLSSDAESRRSTSSALSTTLDVRRTRLSTVGNRAFPVAAAGTVFHRTSLLTPLSIFCSRVKSHIFLLSYPSF